MTSNYQDVRDDARNSRDILAHRSKLASAPTGASQMFWNELADRLSV